MICKTVGMSEKKNPLGPTGETVRRNVIRLRGGMQYKDLAERLVQIGRPIPALGLRRIEAGERRVDVDDLVALAVVFGVSPLSLLLPDDGARSLASPMTGVPDREVAHNTQWLWALGEEPLYVPDWGKANGNRAIKMFQLRSMPEVEERSPDYTGRSGGDLGDHKVREMETRQSVEEQGIGGYEVDLGDD